MADTPVAEADHFSKHTRVVQVRINRRCVICGQHLCVTVYDDDSYEGGEYFGDMPALARRKRRRDHDDADIAEEIWRHSHEYWECPACASD